MAAPPAPNETQEYWLTLRAEAQVQRDRAHRVAQAPDGRERSCGPAYGIGLTRLDWYRGGEYLVTDQLGMPVHPEWYSDEFGRLLKRIGLRRISLHDSRHTTLTLMEQAGVPISIVSKWAGHYDAAFSPADVRPCEHR